MGKSIVAAPLHDCQPSRYLQQKVALNYWVLSPAPREVWRELYHRDPEALPSQSPEWLDCICTFKAYEDASRLYEFPDSQQLLVPIVRRKGLPKHLSIEASLPHAWSVGGIVSKRPPRPEELATVFKDLVRSPHLTISLFPNPRQGRLWEAARPAQVMAIPRRAHVLDLEGGFDRVWSERFTKTTRNRVRKAEKAGVVVECDTTGRLAPVFYDLHRRSIDRWAEQQREPRWLAHWRADQRDPLRKLEHIAKSMGEACRIWVAWHDGHPVATSLVLLNGNADDMMGAMDKERSAPVCANDLLLRHTIEHACRTGCQQYHLGESGESQGLAKFKERFGAEAYEYEEYRHEHLPLSRLDRGLRSVVKRAIGFRDA